MDDKKFQNYFSKEIEERYKSAKFYLQILIESDIIKSDDETLKSLFIKWFSENKNFDLQIKNGDFQIEDGDLKFVPDFEKNDIIEFVKWFNLQKIDFLNFLNQKGISTDAQKYISNKTITTQNLIINNGEVKKINQNNYSEKKTKFEIVSIVGLIIAFLAFIFGDNIYDRINKKNLKEKIYKNNSIFSISPSENHNEKFVDYFQINFEPHPIIDHSLFVKKVIIQYQDSLSNPLNQVYGYELGGANISDISKIGVRGTNGEQIIYSKDTLGNFYFDKLPYIEFNYKELLYNLEIGNLSSNSVTINLIDTPTLKLDDNKK